MTDTTGIEDSRDITVQAVQALQSSQTFQTLQTLQTDRQAGRQAHKQAPIHAACEHAASVHPCMQARMHTYNHVHCLVQSRDSDPKRADFTQAGADFIQLPRTGNRRGNESWHLVAQVNQGCIGYKLHPTRISNKSAGFRWI